MQLGLYGSFGYDLTFQFESIKLAQERDPNQRDLLLYLADELVVVDQSRHSAIAGGRQAAKEAGEEQTEC